MAMLRTLQMAGLFCAAIAIVDQIKDELQDVELLEKKCGMDEDCLCKLKQFSSRDQTHHEDWQQGFCTEPTDNQCEEILHWCESIADADCQNWVPRGANKRDVEKLPHLPLEPFVLKCIVASATNSQTAAKEEEEIEDIFSVEVDSEEVEINLDETLIDLGAPPSKLHYFAAVVSAALLVYATLYVATRVVRMLMNAVLEGTRTLGNLEHGRRRPTAAAAAAEHENGDLTDPALLKHRMRLKQEARARVRAERINANIDATAERINPNLEERSTKDSQGKFHAD